VTVAPYNCTSLNPDQLIGLRQPAAAEPRVCLEECMIPEARRVEIRGREQWRV